MFYVCVCEREIIAVNMNVCEYRQTLNKQQKNPYNSQMLIKNRSEEGKNATSVLCCLGFMGTVIQNLLRASSWGMLIVYTIIVPLEVMPI